MAIAHIAHGSLVKYTSHRVHRYPNVALGVSSGDGVGECGLFWPLSQSVDNCRRVLSRFATCARQFNKEWFNGLPETLDVSTASPRISPSSDAITAAVDDDDDDDDDNDDDGCGGCGDDDSGSGSGSGAEADDWESKSSAFRMNLSQF
ncbi:hypothetical protein GQ42DRAFT_163095 [Ramicandelaber brevisporus]|nr:hypothetical protein GQ42DRAFT_163095 [Ramicandelaber brevisporus]